MKHRPWSGYVLAAIGVIILLSEIALHYYGYFHGKTYELDRPVLYVGLVIGFVGFYMINPKGAEGGTDILTRTVVALISVVRTGKRAGDGVSVEVTPVTGGVPDPSATQTVTIPNPPAAADASTAAILASESAARLEKHTLSPPIIGEGG
jgi:hypothetical protein